ncbi:hypothetical protein [Noviherbaspirillum saxi]|uniref:Uncharacterized protein n=1 Tax=Noviherbaspirillum saxi TaxID=2320863 RepID=A0A3A3FWQ5_9BURK|nr:hypothetical protein [Noviherbaspirillum saxi]RJF99068.1 hypothetical protein D3871_11490 [Noviherbaspirillum saxi]
MSNPKVHYHVYEVMPSESDPDGSGSTACGLDYAENATDRSNAVTCKNCLRQIAATQPKGEGQ